MTEPVPSRHMVATQHRCSYRRRGVSMMEIVAATAILAVMAMLLVPVIGGVAEVREGAAQHQLAVFEAANLMERVAVLRANGPLTRQQLEELSLSRTARDQLTEPQLAFSLGEAAGSPPARALTIEISWENQHGQRGVPVQVVTYLYESEEPGDAQP